MDFSSRLNKAIAGLGSVEYIAPQQESEMKGLIGEVDEERTRLSERLELIKGLQSQMQKLLDSTPKPQNQSPEKSAKTLNAIARGRKIEQIHVTKGTEAPYYLSIELDDGVCLGVRLQDLDHAVTVK